MLTKTDIKGDKMVDISRHEGESVTFKVIRGFFFSGNINAKAPEEYTVEDIEQLSIEQIRDIVEGYLLNNLEIEDKSLVTKLSKKYLQVKGKQPGEGSLREGEGLLRLDGDSPGVGVDPRHPEIIQVPDEALGRPLG